MRKAFVLVFCFFGFAGCAAPPYIRTISTSAAGAGGIYHSVERGQTLWRISKIYNVDLDELIKVNRVLDASNIEAGQKILIPSRRKQQRIPAGSEDDFIWPVKGRVITVFGQVYNNMRSQGINIQPYGDRNVFASRAGRVVFLAEALGAFGKTIIIDHEDGLFSVYSRCEQVFVKTGDYVCRGALISNAGGGKRDTGIYLHFQIRKGRIARNPRYYLS